MYGGFSALLNVHEKKRKIEKKRKETMAGNRPVFQT